MGFFHVFLRLYWLLRCLRGLFSRMFARQMPLHNMLIAKYQGTAWLRAHKSPQTIVCDVHMVRQRLFLWRNGKSVLSSRHRKGHATHRFESQVTTFHGAGPIAPKLASPTGLFGWYTILSTGGRCIILFMRSHMRSESLSGREGLTIAFGMRTRWRMIISNVALQFRPRREILHGSRRSPRSLCAAGLQRASIPIALRVTMSGARLYFACGTQLTLMDLGMSS